MGKIRACGAPQALISYLTGQLPALAKVVSFLPTDSGVWSAKPMIRHLLKYKYSSGFSLAFHANLWYGVLLQGGRVYEQSSEKILLQILHATAYGRV